MGKNKESKNPKKHSSKSKQKHKHHVPSHEKESKRSQKHKRSADNLDSHEHHKESKKLKREKIVEVKSERQNAVIEREADSDNENSCQNKSSKSNVQSRPSSERDHRHNKTSKKESAPLKSKHDKSNHSKSSGSHFNPNQPIKREPESDREIGSNKKREAPHRKENLKQLALDWGIKHEDSEKDAKEPSRELPNFGTSGRLAEDTNMFNGVLVKYNEPMEARQPKRRWRLYVFKGEQSLPTLYIHRQSAFLLGRDRRVADIPIDHPSCSKQHAVIQFRMVGYEREDGRPARRIRPYILDMESANGTYVNNQRIESRRYLELFEKDVLKFGYSSREYVLLHEDSKEDVSDDNIENPEI